MIHLVQQNVRAGLPRTAQWSFNRLDSVSKPCALVEPTRLRLHVRRKIFDTRANSMHTASDEQALGQTAAEAAPQRVEGLSGRRYTIEKILQDK